MRAFDITYVHCREQDLPPIVGNLDYNIEWLFSIFDDEDERPSSSLLLWLFTVILQSLLLLSSRSLQRRNQALLSFRDSEPPTCALVFLPPVTET